MRKNIFITLLTLTLASSAFAATEGLWTASVDEKKPDHLYLSVVRERNHQNGMTMKIADLAGLTVSQINAATMTPVQFELRREAGTASFEGTFRNAKGAGQFTFAGNRAYLETLRSLGVEGKLGRREKSEDELLFTLAMFDVSTSFIRSMQAAGYRVGLDDYVEMRIFNVNPELIRELASLGFKNVSADDLVATRVHGVTPAYIRAMRAAGWNLSLDDYQSSRIHGATPEFAAEMKKLGYGNLDHDALVSFRIHGVTAKFITELRELGYDKISADDLVAMRIHGVTPKFIREMNAAGYSKVPVDKLVAMRIHGLDAEFVKRMNDVD